MKIFFFNRFFHPDTSATSQIVSDLAFHLAGCGHEVHAVTSRVPGGTSDLETIRGVTVHRVATAASGPHGLFARGLAYLEYYRGARRAVGDLVSAGDVVVAKTDPPLLSAAIGPLARRRGAKVVAWLQDVFPEVAHEYGVPGMGWPLGSWSKRVRDRSLVEADHVVAIGELMARRIASIPGVRPERVTVIHNWADGEAITPIDRKLNELRRAWNLEREFVVGYSGNLGRVHEFETILDAAGLLKGDAGIRFLIIGRGPRLQEVESRVEREALANVRFEPHQHREMLGRSLGVADVHLAVLKPGFEGLVHPSKLYGIMAAGRPTIFIGDAKGEAASIIASARAGVCVRSGDASGLATAIRSMQADEKSRLEMGEAARRVFEERYSMPIALEAWERVLDALARR